MLHLYQSLSRLSAFPSFTNPHRVSWVEFLSQMALSLLTEYWFAYDRPRGWLFPKQTRREDPRPIDTFYLSRHIHAHERELGWEDFSSSIHPSDVQKKAAASHKLMVSVLVSFRAALFAALNGILL